MTSGKEQRACTDHGKQIQAVDQRLPAHRSYGRSQEARLARTTFDLVQPVILESIGERRGFVFWQQIVEIREMQRFLLTTLGEQGRYPTRTRTIISIRSELRSTATCEIILNMYWPISTGSVERPSETRTSLIASCEGIPPTGTRQPTDGVVSQDKRSICTRTSVHLTMAMIH